MHDTRFPEPGQTEAPICPNPAESRRVVLVGAGHAHLHVVSQARRFSEAGAELVLVEPGDFWYSGLATGILGGQYAPDDGRVDVSRLARRAGCALIRARLVGIDAATRRIRLDDGTWLPFAALSLNLGSEVAGAVDGRERGTPVKPIEGLLRADLRGDVVIVGGGATGCEVAANLAAGKRDRDRAPRITLIARGPLLAGYPAGAARRLARYLASRGIVLLRDRTALAIREAGGRLQVALAGADRRESAAESVSADRVLLATGLRPPAALSAMGLPSGPGGGLAVEPTLEARGLAGVFGVGDCVDFLPRPLPKLGVYAVRQAPVLADNLLATLRGDTLRPYRPQPVALSILNLGGEAALAAWGPLWWLGKVPMRWKDRLDLRFLAGYRA